MENKSNSDKSLPKNAQLSKSQRTSCQTGSQTVSKHSQTEEDPNEITNNFKKVGQIKITVLCSVCQQSVHISQLFHHKKAHQAQATLGYQHPWTETIDTNKIALQRQQLISNMIKTSTYTERAREKIGYSFEFLKESLKIAPYFCINSIVQSSVHIKEVSSPLIKAIAICQDKNTLWHTELQDLFVVLDNYGNRSGTCFLGLFDGSNGVSAAETTSAELPLLFLEQLSSIDPSYQVSEAERQVLDSFCTVFRADYKLRERIFTARHTASKEKNKTSLPKNYEWIHRAYAKSFWRMDRLLRLGRNEVSRVCWSSCTAATCLVETISNVKQQQPDQEVEKKLGRRRNEREQIITQLEKQQPERIMISGKQQSNIEEQGVAPLLSNQKTEGIKTQEEEEEGLRKIKEDTSVSEQGVAPLLSNQKTEGIKTQEEELKGIKEDTSVSEQGVAPLLSNQKTEGIKTQEEEEELKGIKEDTSVSEQGVAPLLSNQKTESIKPQEEEEEEEEELKRINEDTSVSEQGVAPLLSNQKTEGIKTQEEEEEELKGIKEDTSVSEQGVAPLLSNQKTESIKPQEEEEEEELKRINEDTSVSEQGVAPLLSNQKTEGIKTQEEEEEEGELKGIKEDTSVSQQGVAPLLSNQKTEGIKPQEEKEEEEFKRINEDTSVSEQGVAPLLSNQKTEGIKTQEEEEEEELKGIKEDTSVSEQEVAPFLSNQKTEGIKTQEEEEKELKCINADRSVSEQEDKELPPSNKDSTRKKDLLENNYSTAQPDESSSGVMHIANIGNVHALLCKNGKSYWLTKDHTTYCKEEKTRVLEKGGYISSNDPNGLIEGLVRTTRGLGHHGNPTLKKTVIPVPHTISFPIDGSCQFLILASNGLWEVLDKSEVAALTLIMFSAYLKKYQQVQQEKKRRTPKGSKSTVDGLKGVISWYFNPELFFTETENNQNQNNANLGPTENSSDEGENGQSGSSHELDAEATDSTEDTTTTTESGSQEGSKESQISSKSIEEEVPESPSETFSQISEDEEANPKTFYNHAAKYISKHLVKAALKAGSRDNITVLVALLNGCDKIPTYI